MSDPIVGIDLGTSNTVIAHADGNGAVRVLSDEAGFKIHPSVVSFHPSGGVVVGAAAKQRKVIDPQNTIYSIKRLIGRGFNSPEVQSARKRSPFQIKEGANQQPMISTRGGDFAVPEISAIVLDHVRNLASTQLDAQVQRAVVTVPASFNDAQRSATATAGAIAGMTIMRVLNEPTAAALAYGHSRSLNQTIAVYDFGGGTFDITILRLADQVYEVLGTAGESFLGGDDLDERLVDKMVERFLKETRIDLRSNEVSMMRLRAVAEQTKIELSRRSRAVVRIDEIAYGARGAPLNLQIEISRDDFVSQVADIIDKTFPTCKEALNLAQLGIDRIDDVILVGGTTKIPYVRDQVSKFFARAPRTDVSPEEAIAQGAALQASSLDRMLTKSATGRIAAASPSASTTVNEPFTEEAAPTRPKRISSMPVSEWEEEGAENTDVRAPMTDVSAPRTDVTAPITDVSAPLTAAREPFPPSPADGARAPRTRTPSGGIAPMKQVAPRKMFDVPDRNAPKKPEAPVQRATLPPKQSRPPASPPKRPTSPGGIPAAPPPAPPPRRPTSPSGVPPVSAPSAAAASATTQVIADPSAPSASSASTIVAQEPVAPGRVPQLRPDSHTVTLDPGDLPQLGTAPGVGPVGHAGVLDMLPAQSMRSEPVGNQGTFELGASGPTKTSPGIAQAYPANLPESEQPANQPNQEASLYMTQPMPPPVPPAAPRRRPPSKQQPVYQLPEIDEDEPPPHMTQPMPPPQRAPKAPTRPPQLAQPPTQVQPLPPPPPQAPAPRLSQLFDAADEPAPAWNFEPLPPMPPPQPMQAYPSPPAQQPPYQQQQQQPYQQQQQPYQQQQQPSYQPQQQPYQPPPQMQAQPMPDFPQQAPAYAAPFNAGQAPQPPAFMQQPMPHLARQPGAYVPEPMPAVRAPVILDVTPRSLGIGTVAGFCEELIRRNSRVPTEIKKSFTTSRDAQESVRIVVCQGESRRIDNNVILGDLHLLGIPARARGETTIDVTFSLDASGILQVSARDAETGAEQRTTLDLVGAMPAQGVDEARERIAALRR